MFSLAAIIVAIVGSLWFFNIHPSRMIAEIIPDTLRKGLGKTVITQISSGKKPCVQADGQRALEKIMARLNSGINAGHSYQVRVIKFGVINAFAVPGEQIVLTAKLIGFVKSPEELAAILAHEIGHGLEKHPETSLIRSLGLTAGLYVLFGGTVGQLGELGTTLLQLKYTREGEREADQHAIDILRKGEIRLPPFARFFERLQKIFTVKNKKDEKQDKSKNKPSSSQTIRQALDLLSSHPSLEERVRKIRSIKKWSSRPLLSNSEWQALREICN